MSDYQQRKKWREAAEWSLFTFSQYDSPTRHAMACAVMQLLAEIEEAEAELAMWRTYNMSQSRETDQWGGP